MHTTTILGQEVGIQYQGVQDKTNLQQFGNQSNLLMIVENLPRGRDDKIINISDENLVSALGREKDNLYLQAVQDAVFTGVPSVAVLRVTTV